jgi:hypothetical protein
MALIQTTKGEMEESLLEKKTGVVDNENENTTWVEYWLKGELVHRSAHVTVKKQLSLTSEVGGFHG